MVNKIDCNGRFIKGNVPTNKFTIEEVIKLANEKGIELLSNEYESANSKLLWKCKNGHIWLANFKNMKHLDRGCPECAGNKHLTLEIVMDRANKIGIKCLSTKYTNNHTKMEWECNKGHKWSAMSSHIMNKSVGCPYCSGLKKMDYNIQPNKEIVDIIDGCLLGDGHITKVGNVFQVTSVSKKFIDYLENVFIKNSILLRQLRITDECIKQFPGNAKPSKCKKKYTLATSTYDFLKQLRKRWYPNGKKIVPNNMGLSPIILLYWYLGDGCVNHHGGNCWVIELATNGFSYKDNIELQSKFKDAFGIDSHVYPCRKNNTYRMSISGIDNVIKFFDVIGSCPFEFENEMGYKFPNIKITNWNGKGKEKTTIEKELLEALYWGNQLNYQEIASMLKCSCVTICRRMKLYDILTRDTRFKVCCMKD
jgi:hypothetical protein